MPLLGEERRDRQPQLGPRRGRTGPGRLEAQVSHTGSVTWAQRIPVSTRPSRCALSVHEPASCRSRDVHSDVHGLVERTY